jgi:hypothetical protein
MKRLVSTTIFIFMAALVFLVVKGIRLDLQHKSIPSQTYKNYPVTNAAVVEKTINTRGETGYANLWKDVNLTSPLAQIPNKAVVQVIGNYERSGIIAMVQVRYDGQKGYVQSLFFDEYYNKYYKDL